MYKSAFFPVTPLRISSKEEYYSPEGERKRTFNKTVSSVLGAGAGMATGTALGLLAGKILKAKYPGRFGVHTKRFISLGEKTGFNPVAPYIREYVKRYGASPVKVPAHLHLPVGGAIVGSAAGMIPAEYRAIRKMEKNVDISPEMSKKEYMKKEITPMLAGATAAVTATEILAKLKRGQVPTESILRKIAPAALSASAYAAVNNMAWKAMNRQKIKSEDHQ